MDARRHRDANCRGWFDRSVGRPIEAMFLRGCKTRLATSSDAQTPWHGILDMTDEALMQGLVRL